MEHLFVYGTLRDADVQTRIIGRSVAGEADALPDFTKNWITIADSTYPIIVPKTGDVVEGQVLELSEDELKRTDDYEGAEYRRLWVTLASGREAWVYCE